MKDIVASLVRAESEPSYEGESLCRNVSGSGSDARTIKIGAVSFCGDGI